MSLDAQTVSHAFHRRFVDECCAFFDEPQGVVLEDGKQGTTGYARIQVTVHRRSRQKTAARQSLRLQRIEKSGTTQWFPHLAEEKCADFALLIHRHKDTAYGFVIECKETVSATEWDKVKLQLAGMIARLRSMAGALDVQLSKVDCYTAFRRDALSDQLDTAPSRRRGRLGQPAPKGLHRDWLKPEIELPQMGSFHHAKIKIDGNGLGTLNLPV